MFALATLRMAQPIDRCCVWQSATRDRCVLNSCSSGRPVVPLCSILALWTATVDGRTPWQPECGHFDSKTWPLASSVDQSRSFVCASALPPLIRCQTATFHLVIRSSGVAQRALLPAAEQATHDTCCTKAAPCCKSCLDLSTSSDRHGRDRVDAAARELVCDNGNTLSTSSFAAHFDGNVASSESLLLGSR